MSAPAQLNLTDYHGPTEANPSRSSASSAKSADREAGKSSSSSNVKPPFPPLPPVDPSEVRQLIDLLSASGCWLTAEQIAEQIGWNDRKTRRLAAESDGLIISGNSGYKHTKHATPDELNEFWGRMVSQGKQMIQRAIRAKRKHHALVG